MDKQQAQEYADAIKIVCKRCLYSSNPAICNFDNCPCVRSMAQHIAAEQMHQFITKLEQEDNTNA